jgi:hypothetical protein
MRGKMGVIIIILYIISHTHKKNTRKIYEKANKELAFGSLGN